MKTIAKISAFLFIGALFLTATSCNKYEEGPTVTLLSRTNRLANRWEVDNYKINGSDYTSLVSGYSETFSKSGAYSYAWGILNGAGTWVFQNNDMEVKLTGNDNHSSRTLYILKLEKKSFWYYYTEDGDRHEFHMISK